MEELSGLDATFLYVETDSAHMHVVGTIVLEAGAQPFRFENIERMLASRIHQIPAFRRRMLHVPFRLGHPIWVDDPDFRLSAHLHRIALPKPGSIRELESFVGHIAGIPLDRSRPLWDLWVVENLEDGGTALVCKFHHAAIDGVAGADLMQHLLDLSPEWEGDSDQAPPKWQPEPPPSDVQLIARAAAELAAQPLRVIQSLGDTATSMLQMVKTYLDPTSDVTNPALPLSSPNTLMNNAISSDRCAALGEVALCDIKKIKNTLGLTVNDVILAACSLALREYLDGCDDLPDEPLVAAIPVSLHDDDDSGANNALSAMFVRLPVHLRHPLDQLEFVAAEASEAKALHRSSTGSLLSRWAEFASPTWFAGLINVYSRYNLADTHAPIYNLIVSNVPGPPMPLYCVGQRVRRCHPLGPIFEGAAVNITVMSYVDSVGVGILACPDSTPDIRRMAEGFEKAVDAMLQAVTTKSRRKPRGARSKTVTKKSRTSKAKPKASTKRRRKKAATSA